MELKVWVDGAQRIVCGVTEATTCQEVVIALAQAIGRTGRYTLVEKWRETERHLAPNENPLAALNKWGQYACDVQLILHRTGPSLSERPTSDSISRAPERTLYRQSLPPLAKLRPPNDRSLRRKEPKRKSLTFTAGPKGLIDIFGKGKESEIKHRVLHSQSTLDEFRKLVGLQKDRLQSLDGQLESNKNETRYWEGRIRSNGVEDDVVRLEQAVKKNGVEIEEEEFWENERQIEEENEKQLKDQLEEVAGRTHECEDKLKEYSAKMLRIQNGIESETLRQELRESQLNEEEVKGNIVKIKGEIEIKCQHTTRLENSLKAVERTLGQVIKKFQEKETELELLTKELRQVNLQQFIQQTGTKVTVLPAEPMDEEHSQQHKKELPILTGSLRRPNSSRQLPSNLRILQNPLTSGFNPEGIYV